MQSVSCPVQRIPTTNIRAALTIAVLLFPGLCVLGGFPAILVIYPAFCFLMIIGFSVLTQPDWWLFAIGAILFNYAFWVAVVYLFVRLWRFARFRQTIPVHPA
jgi:hypothetical protein